MLAKFENGYFLEVVHSGNEYDYEIYDNELDSVDGGYTEYRSMDMYYPKNLIDYILEFCEPYDLKGQKGKYEILEQETMEEYEKFIKDFLAEDPDGKWILERQGTNKEDIRCYKTKEAAKFVMMKEVEEYRDCKNKDINYINELYCEVTGEEFFQSWSFYKKEYFNNI